MGASEPSRVLFVDAAIAFVFLGGRPCSAHRGPWPAHPVHLPCAPAQIFMAQPLWPLPVSLTFVAALPSMRLRTTMSAFRALMTPRQREASMCGCDHEYR